MKKSLQPILAIGILFSGCGIESNEQDPSGSNPTISTSEDPSVGTGSDLLPNGKGIGTTDQISEHAGFVTNRLSTGMRYHGGPIMLGTVNVYYIWYGNWSSNPTTTILTDFMSNLGGSPYYNINTTYYNSSNVRISNRIQLVNSIVDNYSQGTALTDTKIGNIVSNAITNGLLPLDSNGVYFVLSSSDVSEVGFCTQFCGWHTYKTISGKSIKYSFVGDPTRCPSACEVQTTGPNGTTGADGMASIIAHELEETTSDPNLNAWYDSRGYENADKCAWTFGSTYTVSNGSKANMRLGSRDFMIQQNWVNAGGGYCAKSYP